MSLPLFPLRTVLFPNGFLQLRIFEPRYLDMIRDCASNQTGFGICLLLDADEENHHAAHSRIGTLANIVDFYTLKDGLLGISAKGTERFAITGTSMRDNGLLTAEVDWLPEIDGVTVPEQHSLLPVILKRYLEQAGLDAIAHQKCDFDDAGFVSYRLAEILPLENQLKQRLLEIHQPLERLDLLQNTLAQHALDD